MQKTLNAFQNLFLRKNFFNQILLQTSLLNAGTKPLNLGFYKYHLFPSYDIKIPGYYAM